MERVAFDALNWASICLGENYPPRRKTLSSHLQVEKVSEEADSSAVRAKIELGGEWPEGVSQIKTEENEDNVVKLDKKAKKNEDKWDFIRLHLHR